jgi:hypothetical protein
LVHDDLVNKGGFGTTYQRADHGRHGEVLVRRSQEFREAAAAGRDSALMSEVFMQVRTPDEVPIRGEKQRLRGVGIDVVAYSRHDPSAATARMSREGYDDFQARLLRYATVPAHPGRSYFSILEDVAPVPVEEKLSPRLEAAPETEVVDSIILTQAGLTLRERTAILDSIGEFVRERAGEVLGRHDFASGLSTVRVRLARRELEELGHEYHSVREIRPNRVFMVGDSVPIAPMPDPLPVTPPRSRIGVAVVDSGIQQQSYALGPVLIGEDAVLPTGSVEPHRSHGTFVASRVAYGDDLELQIARGRLNPRCYLFDIPIIGRSPVGTEVYADEHGVAAALDTTLVRLPEGVRVVNLSLGTDDPIGDHEYTLVASTVDFLAREHDLLVVTTAGNVRDRALVSTYPAAVGDPEWRIDPPGEALLAITVGSIAHHADQHTLSAARELSPFSRVGPGADGGRKPEVVAHGGNYARPCNPVSRYAVQGIFGDGRTLAWDAGTSFAAPVVAGVAAELFGAYPGAQANLVKALLCHFTRSAEAPPGEDDGCRCVGLGEPDLAAALSAAQGTASFIYTGQLTDDRYLFIPFYVPEMLAAHVPDSRLEVRGTIVYDPPVNVVNPVEYSQSRVAAKLRKPTEVGFRDVQLSAYMHSYHPWNPLIHFRRGFSRSYATGYWELQLRLYTRDLPDDFKQNFAVVLEVRDSRNGGGDVWAAVRDEVGDQFQPAKTEAA